MAVSQSDGSRITKHIVNLTFSNLIVGVDYIIKFDITSSFTGLHTITPSTHSFTASSTTYNLPIQINKNISVKLMILTTTITNLKYNLSSSNTTSIMCLGFNGCN